ncbi:MAG: class I SAM-dependent methyltransferase [Acidobacteria bacterium]|nr:class I SAM-dependent methyltransferase [Acidobacteriota bacterium]
MAKPGDWERFFDAHAPDYMNNCFVQNTKVEVDFLLAQLRPPRGGRILDVGCGTGRHAVELALRGFRVTGVDISRGMLAQAASAAERVGARVELVRADAARFRFRPVFDGAICLCEGAFGLLRASDDPVTRDIAILTNVRAALRPGASFMLTALNGLRMARQHGRRSVGSGRFDPLAMTEVGQIKVGQRTFATRERGFVPTELELMFRVAGFDVTNIWGGTAGNWGRRPVDPDEMEIMVTATKPRRGRRRRPAPA